MGNDSRRTNPNRLKRDIYVAAGLTVVAFVIALFFIVDRASDVANGVALQADFKLVNAEAERQRENAEWDMNQATQMLDGFVTMLRKGMMEEFELMGPVLSHYIANDGMAQLVIVDENDKLSFAMKEGQPLDDPRTLPLSRHAVAAAERARDYFQQVLPDMPEGWEYARPVKNDRHLYALGDFAVVEGQFGFIMSQVILPWTEEARDAGRDVPVHVSFRPLNRGDLEAAVERLNLSEFRVSAIEDAPKTAARYDVTSLDGTPAFALLWKEPNPRNSILLAVLPLGVALSSAITALLAIMLRRYRTALSELAASEARNRRMANHDALTGLANRAQFDTRLDRMIAESPNECFAVMCIDLDKFKAVNDTYGHNAGDAVLVAAANRFAEKVGPRGLVARVGGDEFIVLVTAGIKPSMLQSLGDDLIASACEPVMFEGTELQIGASIGVSVWPANGETAKDVINAADQVLYDSKRAGRGRCTLAGQHACERGVFEAA